MASRSTASPLGGRAVLRCSKTDLCATRRTLKRGLKATAKSMGVFLEHLTIQIGTGTEGGCSRICAIGVPKQFPPISFIPLWLSPDNRTTRCRTRQNRDLRGVAPVPFIPAGRLGKGPQRWRSRAGERLDEMAACDPAFRGPVLVRLGLPLLRLRPVRRAQLGEIVPVICHMGFKIVHEL